MSRRAVVSGYARMWPREVFARFPSPKDAASKRKIMMAKGLNFLEGPGVYILYRDDEPYYIGQATRLHSRLWAHAKQAEGRYFHFWNFFSAFAVPNSDRRNELEGILIAAMPTANSSKPRLPRERMPREVRDLLRAISEYRVPKK
jgi:hypothetical protein